MAETDKLELLLTASNKMSPELKKLLVLFRELRRESGKVVSGINHVNQSLNKPIKTGDGLGKLRAEVRAVTRDLKRAAAEYQTLQKSAGSGVKLPNRPSRPTRGGRPGGSDENWLDDAALAGAGAGGLWTAKQGLGAAMSKQEALTDVHSSFYRTNLAAGEFNQQMAEGEKIADKLGSKLKGNTADYLNLLSVMRSRGIETKTILDGAGEAAAYLSVANRADRLTTGENLAQFGQLFDLKGREYIGAADLLSKIKTAKGLDSEELIQGLKFFGGRTATALNLTGAQGAEQSTRFLAFLRQKTALEGSSVGTAASSFFQQFTTAKGKKDDPLKELEKLSKVKLNIFDGKGKFLGLENAVKEFSKLRGKLTDEQMVQFGSKLAGEEGSAIFTAMVQKGNEYAAFNQDINQSTGLMDKAAKESENLTNKVEALTGSLQNLGAAGFAPHLKRLGQFADKTNELVGSLTDLAKANPKIASTAATMLTLGSAYAAFKGTSSVASRFFGGANSPIIAVGDTAADSTKKVNGLRGALSSVGKTVAIGLTATAAMVVIDDLLGQLDKYEQRVKKLEGDNKSTRETYDSLMGQGKLWNFSREKGQNKTELDALADNVLETMKQGTTLEHSLHPSRGSTSDMLWRPFWGVFGGDADPYRHASQRYFNPDKAAATWQKQDIVNTMAEPNVLARLLLKIERGAGMGLGGEQITLLKSAIEKTVGKEKFQAAAGIANQEILNQPKPAADNPFKQLQQPITLLNQQTSRFGQDLGLLSQPITGTTTNFQGLIQPSSDLIGNLGGLNNQATPLGTAFGTAGTAANNFANRVNALEIRPPRFPPITFGTPPSSGKSSLGVPSLAVGGTVRSDGLAYIHKGEKVVPADVVKGYRANSANNRSSATTTNYVTIQVSGDNPKEIAQEIKAVLERLSAKVADIEYEMMPERSARRVAFAAERDAGRI